MIAALKKFAWPVSSIYLVGRLMCVKPKPFSYSCPSCDWKKTVFPKSDVLLPGEHYACCPKCGSKSLDLETLKGVTKLGLGLLQKLFTWGYIIELNSKSNVAYSNF